MPGSGFFYAKSQVSKALSLSTSQRLLSAIGESIHKNEVKSAPLLVEAVVEWTPRILVFLETLRCPGKLLHRANPVCSGAYPKRGPTMAIRREEAASETCCPKCSPRIGRSTGYLCTHRQKPLMTIRKCAVSYYRFTQLLQSVQKVVVNQRKKESISNAQSKLLRQAAGLATHDH